MKIQLKHPLPGHARGLTLVEIMVALTISLILLAGILTIFASTKATFLNQEALSRLQENGRYAMNRMLADFRMAGYTGCDTNITNHLNPAGLNYSSSLFDFNTAIGGWEYIAGSGTGPNDLFTISSFDPSGEAAGNWNNSAGEDLYIDLRTKVVPGTDVIVTKRVVDDLNIRVETSPSHIISAQSIQTVTPSGLPKYSIVMITEDCNDSDLFQTRNEPTAASISKGAGSTTNPGPGNFDPPSLTGGAKWSRAYSGDAKFLLPETTVYYIGEGSSGEPSLFRVNFSLGSVATPHEELIAGVENMQALYGEDTDADGIANRYLPINQVDPANVASIRISLLIRSINQVRSTTNAEVYRLTGHKDNTSTRVDPINDRRIRQVFSSTIKLRNRGVR